MLPGNLDRIAKTRCREQCRQCALAFDQCVGDQGRSVDQRTALAGFDRTVIQGWTQRVLHSQTWIPWSGESLANHSAAVFTDQEHVGKRPADIEAAATHRKRVQQYVLSGD